MAMSAIDYEVDRARRFPHHASMAKLDEQAASAAALPVAALAFRPALILFFRRKTHDPQEIDDLLQEVFLRIVARRSAEGVDNIGGYVFQTAASVLADRYRRGVVRHAGEHVEFEGAIHGESDFDAVRILEGRQALQAASDALYKLPERTRAIFVLRRLDQRTYKEIAVQIGISVSAVEKHMARAIHHLIATPGCF